MEDYSENGKLTKNEFILFCLKMLDWFVDDLSCARCLHQINEI